MIQPELLHLSFYYGPSSFVHGFIRAWSRSRVSHVEIVRPGDVPGDGAECECIAATIAEGREVRKRRKTFTSGEWFHVAIEWVDPDEAWGVASAEVGKPYDMRGLILSHMFNARRETPGKWFCSELAAHTAKIASPQDYSPGQLLLRVRERNAAWRAARAGHRFLSGPAVDPFGPGDMPMSSAPFEEETEAEAAPPPSPADPIHDAPFAAPPEPPSGPGPVAVPSAPPPAPGPSGGGWFGWPGRTAAPAPTTRPTLGAPPDRKAPPLAEPDLPDEVTRPIDVPADPAAAEALFERLYDAPPGEGVAS